MADMKIELYPWHTPKDIPSQALSGHEHRHTANNHACKKKNILLSQQRYFHHHAVREEFIYTTKSPQVASLKSPPPTERDVQEGTIGVGGGRRPCRLQATRSRKIFSRVD
jgi:hypothetical protein